LPTDDLTLVRRARSGDQRAFTLLVERYQKKVYAVALGMVKDAEEAMDVSQEAFVKVHRYLDRFKGDSSFYTWLYRITTNTCIDVLRRRGVTSNSSDSVEYDDTVELDGTEANLSLLGSQLDTSPARSALRRELGEKLEDALAQLPEKHRAVLLLRELEGMSYDDLARTLEIPKGTVMSRLFHARAKVQRLLSAYLDDEPGAANSPRPKKGGQESE
jgi:RNA polymerase sigma-70 factor (ECF subfamily)